MPLWMFFLIFFALHLPFLPSGYPDDAGPAMAYAPVPSGFLPALADLII